MVFSLLRPGGSVRTRGVPAVTAALACAVATLGVVGTGGGDAQATTPATCTVTSQPLGAATGWTEFVEGGGTRGSESEGAIAWGGNLSANGMTVGTRLPAAFPAGQPALVVGGSHGTFNLQKGSAYVSPRTGVNFNGGGSYLAGNPIDFAGAFAELRARSAAWGTAPANGAVLTGVAGGNPAWVLHGTDPRLNVFTLSAADLATGRHLAYDVPAGSTVLVNVSGQAVTLTGQMWIGQGSGAQQANDGVMQSSFPGVLWNFPDATTVTMSFGSAWGGTILAPNATLTIGSVGHTIGQVIAKSFSSGFETHQNLFPEQPCLPAPPDTPKGPADVRITKTASDAHPHGGDGVTYTLTAENVGLDTATGVVVHDTLPTGVTFDSASPGCTEAAGTVTCPVGDLAVGASASVSVKVVAYPVAGAGPAPQPQAYHWLTPYKLEQQVDLDPGQTRSVTVACNAGDILSDGSIRVDHVDQGTGDPTDVKVQSAESTDVGTWKAVVRNDATGRAQAKAFVVCLPAYTEAADRQTGYDDRHRHPLSADTALATHTEPFGVGRHDASVACPTGTTPIVPGFALSGGAATLAGSEPSGDRGWSFTLDVTDPTTATFSARCLRTTVGPVYGHTHDLVLTHVVEQVTVPATTPEEGVEEQVICPDDAKGILATWHLPPGVRTLGNDPRLKARAFRLLNQTGGAQAATVDLVCLHDRTSLERMGTDEPVVVENTATVTSTSPDATAANNSSTASITVQPGTATTGLVSAAHLLGQSFSERVVSSMPGRAAVAVRVHGKVAARGSVRLRAGRSSVARLHLTAKGEAMLVRAPHARVRIDPTRGRATARTVRLR